MNPRLLFILLFSSTAALAQKSQEDYLVKATGDTLRGRVQQVGKNYKMVRLHRPGMPPMDFNPGEVASYGSAAGVTGVSKKVGAQGKPQFLVPLVTGYVSLYSGINDGQEKRFYLQPADSSHVVEVSPVTAQLTYARLLSGCPSFEFGSNQVQAKYPYTAAGVSQLVLDYNQCRQPQAPTQAVKRDAGIRTRFGLKAGINTSDFSVIAEEHRVTHTDANSYQAGVMLNVATRTRFSLQLEAVYVMLRSSYSPSEVSNFNKGIPANSYATRMQFSQIQAPILVRYSIGNGAFRPYLNAGPSLAYNFSNKSAFNFPTTTTSVREIPIELAKSSIGFAAGTGLEIYIPSLPNLSVEARYDRMIDNRDYRFYTPKHTSFRLDVGVYF